MNEGRKEIRVWRRRSTSSPRSYVEWGFHSTSHSRRWRTCSWSSSVTSTVVCTTSFSITRQAVEHKLSTSGRRTRGRTGTSASQIARGAAAPRRPRALPRSSIQARAPTSDASKYPIPVQLYAITHLITQRSISVQSTTYSTRHTVSHSLLAEVYRRTAPGMYESQTGAPLRPLSVDSNTSWHDGSRHASVPIG